MRLHEGLIEKSIESFSMAIEIYHKPTMKYRMEGFTLYMCNAWELLLKAHMIKRMGKKSIYFEDHPDRTLSFENCIQKVFTNNKDPLRLNLEKMIELKNTSPIFIIEEYELIYAPLFQSCVLNYIEKMNVYHDVNIDEIVRPYFLTLPVNSKPFKDEDIRERYPVEIAKKTLDMKKKMDELTASANAKFAIRLDNLDSLNRAKEKIKATHDPQSYKITAKLCILYIRDHLNKAGIELLYDGKPAKFNNFHLNNFMKHFKMKTNEKYCYVDNSDKQPQYTYSHKAVEFIYEELAKDPQNILNRIKK